MKSREGATIFHGRNPNALFIDVLKTILNEGHDVAPRGMPTKELLGVTTVIDNPRERLLTMPSRRTNAVFNLLEALWILAGLRAVRYLAPYNKQFLDFSLDIDPTPQPADFYKDSALRDAHTNAPYGYRLRHSDPEIDQFKHVVESLKADRDSRQAVCALWDPHLDSYASKVKDRPCNTTLYFKIRDGKLHLTVSNRSNDVTFGLYNVNFIQFTIIQEALASILGVPVGTYRHYSDSLHAYTTSPWLGVHERVLVGRPYDFYTECSAKTKTLAFRDLSDMDIKLSCLFANIDMLNAAYFEGQDIRNFSVPTTNEANLVGVYMVGTLLLAKAFFLMRQRSYMHAAETIDTAFLYVPDFAAMAMCQLKEYMNAREYKFVLNDFRLVFMDKHLKEMAPLFQDE